MKRGAVNGIAVIALAALVVVLPVPHGAKASD